MKNRIWRRLFETVPQGGGIWIQKCVVSSTDIRWCSKVAEMKAMGTPGWGKIFPEKNLVGKYFFELDFAGDPSILGEIPVVKDSQFKWKIEGSRTKSSSKKYFPTRFFAEKIFPHPGVPIAFISATLEHQRMSVELRAQLWIHIPPSGFFSNNRIHDMQTKWCFCTHLTWNNPNNPNNHQLRWNLSPDPGGIWRQTIAF